MSTRKCTICKKNINKGYYLAGDYACSIQCRNKWMKQQGITESWRDLYDDGESDEFYYTEWEVENPSRRNPAGSPVAQILLDPTFGICKDAQKYLKELEKILRGVNRKTLTFDELRRATNFADAAKEYASTLHWRLQEAIYEYHASG